MGKNNTGSNNAHRGTDGTVKKSKTLIITAIAVFMTAIIMNGQVSHAKSESYIESAYRQLVTEKSNTAAFEAPEGLGAYEILADLVKIDDENNLYDGTALRNRGNWVLLQQGTTYRLIAENGYEVKKADAIAQEIADEVRSLSKGTTDRELFYEYLKYMDDNFHYSLKISRNTQKMNKKGVIIDTDNFTETYYTDKGLNCAGYATLTYLVANKLGIKCEMVEAGTHVYNAVKFNDSDEYVTFDLTKGTKFASLGHIGKAIIDVKTATESSRKKKLIKACNGSRSYKAAGLSEFVKELKYFLA